MQTLSEKIVFCNREQEKIYTNSGIPDLKSRYCFDIGESQESVSLCDLKDNKRLITTLNFDEISFLSILEFLIFNASRKRLYRKRAP
jgi:hypothetical protein